MKQLVLLVAALVLVGIILAVQAQSQISQPSVEGQPPGAFDASLYPYHGRIRIEKDRNEEGYQLRIYSSGDLDPESIQVSIEGRSILIENDSSLRREERNERGWYSYSRNSSYFRRRLSIPRYADVEKMRREVINDVLIITLPYLGGY